MKFNFAAAFAIGLAIIALAVGGIFLLMQRGDRIELPGKISKCAPRRWMPTAPLP